MANETARRLRKTMTPQEVKLWVHLRSWKKRGYHFRRQAPRHDFIVDFACLKYKLIIELDGGQHNFDAHHRRDLQHDIIHNKEGFRVLRFWNNDVDLTDVLEMIDLALKSTPHPVGTQPSLRGLRKLARDARPGMTNPE